MMGLEPTAYALEGHCSFHLRYIPMCVSISCMPTFKALTQRNIPGAASACTSGNASDPVTLGLTDLVLGAAFG